VVDGPPRGVVHVVPLLEVLIVAFALTVAPDHAYPSTPPEQT
jgi:hypothetical protein